LKKNVFDESNFKIGYINKSLVATESPNVSGVVNSLPIEGISPTNKGKKIIFNNHLKHSFNIVTGIENLQNQQNLQNTGKKIEQRQRQQRPEESSELKVGLEKPVNEQQIPSLETTLNPATIKPDMKELTGNINKSVDFNKEVINLLFFITFSISSSNGKY